MLIDYMVKKNRFTYVTNITLPLNNQFDDIRVNNCINVDICFQYSQYSKINIVSYDKRDNFLIEYFGVIVVGEYENIVLLPVSRVLYLDQQEVQIKTHIDSTVAYILLAKTDFAVVSKNVIINGQDLYDFLFNQIAYRYEDTHNRVTTINQIKSLPTADFLLKIPNAFEFTGYIENRFPYEINIQRFIKELLSIVLYTYATDFAYVNNSGSNRKLEYLIRYNIPTTNAGLVEQDLLMKLDTLVNWFCNRIGFDNCLILIQKNYFGELMVTVYKNDRLVFRWYIDALALLCFPDYQI